MRVLLEESLSESSSSDGSSSVIFAFGFAFVFSSSVLVLVRSAGLKRFFGLAVVATRFSVLLYLG